MGFSSLAAAQAARFDSKDVWNQPKDATWVSFFTAIPAVRDTHSLSIDWQRHLGPGTRMVT
jgi:hypothetical protein